MSGRDQGLPSQYSLSLCPAGILTHGDTSQFRLQPLHLESPFRNCVFQIALGRRSPVLCRQFSSHLVPSLPPSLPATNSLGPSMHQAQEPANLRIRQASPASLGLRPRAVKDLARAYMLEKDEETLHSYSSTNPSWCCVPARSSKLTCPHTTPTPISIPILIVWQSACPNPCWERSHVSLAIN